MKNNEIILSYCIWGFNDISPDEISSMLKITPSKTYVRGQRKNPNVTALAKRSGWILDSPQGREASFEDQMNSLLDILEKNFSLFRTLSEKYYCEFLCAVFIYNNQESTPSVHLNARYNQLASGLNIEFDLDLYCMLETTSES